MKRILRRLQREFDRAYTLYFAYVLARYLPFLLVPLYNLCKRKNWIFVVNLVSGVGHVACELDYFCRLPKEKNKKYILFRGPDYCTDFLKDTYAHHFDGIIHPVLYYLLLPVTMRFLDLILDVGTSTLKWQLPPKGFAKAKPTARQSYLYFVSKKAGMDFVVHYYHIRHKTPNYFPLKDLQADCDALLRFINPNGRKLALIQVKHEVRNCIAKSTDPLTLVDTFVYLKKEGYQIILVGREKMPEIFKEFDVINYANSPYATLQNDFALFSMSHFAIGGGGLSYIPDCLDMPYLYLNSWHFVRMLYSPKCITIPALLGSLSFAQQHHRYMDLDNTPDSEEVPKMNARNASSDEILGATKEALNLNETWDERQIRFKMIFPENSIAGQACSRVSSYFLQKHEARFL